MGVSLAGQARTHCPGKGSCRRGAPEQRVSGVRCEDGCDFSSGLSSGCSQPSPHGLARFCLLLLCLYGQRQMPDAALHCSPEYGFVTANHQAG